jgi:hypothetical protein
MTLMMSLWPSPTTWCTDVAPPMWHASGWVPADAYVQLPFFLLGTLMVLCVLHRSWKLLPWVRPARTLPNPLLPCLPSHSHDCDVWADEVLDVPCRSWEAAVGAACADLSLPPPPPPLLLSSPPFLTNLMSNWCGVCSVCRSWRLRWVRPVLTWRCRSPSPPPLPAFSLP